MIPPGVIPSGVGLLISPGHRLIALTGAGGKTSMMRWLADHRRGSGGRVILTTTTKIFPIPGVETILQEECNDFMGRIRIALKRTSCICIARRFHAVSGKLIGLDKEVVTSLHRFRWADTILVEADGAARKPLKAPNDNEPVIPGGTDLCIGVMGLDAAYRPLAEENVHRHEIFSRLTHLAPGEKVTPIHMARLAMAENGLFKGCPSACDRHVFLNKIDIPGGSELVEEFNNVPIEKEQPVSLQWFVGSVRERYMNRLKRGRGSCLSIR